jgi:6-pyruvoyltetrahydropterin/6-carboxytetrahydropterin synthase
MLVPTSPPLISRSIAFSLGRRLKRAAWSAERNAAVYGRDTLPHGNEYTVAVAYAGEPSELDGMILNLSDMKPVVADAVRPLEDGFVNADEAPFENSAPTAENLALLIWERLPAELGEGTLARLRLQESRSVLAEILATPDGPASWIMKVSRQYEFAAAHRLYTSALSEEENLARFDKCSNPAGHGHNYQLSVAVEGTPDPETGYVVPPTLLDRIVNEEVYERFDHKHLNEDCPEFRELVPTSENLARLIFSLLQERLGGEGYRLARIGLHETQKNYFEVEA